MTLTRRTGFSGWTVIALATATLALAGCGRKGGLDLPPQAAAQAAPEPDAPRAQGNIFDPSFGTDGPPAATKGRKRAFVLDPLLGD